MPKLTDMQLIMLTTAIQRPGGNLLPVAESISGAGARLKRSLTGVLKRSFVSEVEVSAAAESWREEGDQRFGLIITDAGRAAINAGGGEDSRAAEPLATGERPANAGFTKKDRVIDLLKRAEGATMEELTRATGWLPHTTRAALTGLRKKGLKVDRWKRDDVTCYRVEARS